MSKVKDCVFIKVLGFGNLDGAKLDVQARFFPRLNCSEEFKVSLSAHSCGAEIVPDDEDRNLVVHGDYYRSWNAGLCVDEMVAARSLKLEPVLLKYSDGV